MNKVSDQPAGPLGLPPRIFLLPLASFAAATEAFVYIGLLTELTSDLGVSLAAGASLAAVFTLVYAVSAPILASLTAGLDRKWVLTLGLLGVALTNVVAALAPNFAVLMASRVTAGFVAALVGPSASVAASHTARPEHRGRALALVLAGTTLAFSLGIPIGSAIGGVFGWRSTFWFATAIAVVAAAAILAGLPRTGGAERGGLASLRLALSPRIRIILLQTTAAFGATFSAVSLIGPIGETLAGLEGGGVGLIQSFIGLGSILGIIVGGRLADGRPRRFDLVWIFLIIAVTQAAISILFYVPGMPSALLAYPLAASIFFGAAALFAIGPIQQTRLIGAAPEQRMVALALHGTSIFLGQSLGAALGAVTVAITSLSWTGFVGAALATGAALLLAAPPRPARP